MSTPIKIYKIKTMEEVLKDSGWDWCSILAAIEKVIEIEEEKEHKDQDEAMLDSLWKVDYDITKGMINNVELSE